MLRIRKERFAPGTYSKLKPRKLGPLTILKRISDNAYVIDLPLHLNINSSFNISNKYPYYPSDEAEVLVPELKTSSSDDPEDASCNSFTTTGTREFNYFCLLLLLILVATFY